MLLKMAVNAAIYFIYYEIRITRFTNKNTSEKKRKYTKIHKKYIMKYIKTIS